MATIKKKKQTIKRGYKKGVILPIASINEMLKQNTTQDEIDLHNHIIYDDGTQSVQITIHYSPNDKTNN